VSVLYTQLCSTHWKPDWASWLVQCGSISSTPSEYAETVEFGKTFFRLRLQLQCDTEILARRRIQLQMSCAHQMLPEEANDITRNPSVASLHRVVHALRQTKLGDYFRMPMIDNTATPPVMLISTTSLQTNSSSVRAIFTDDVTSGDYEQEKELLGLSEWRWYCCSCTPCTVHATTPTSHSVEKWRMQGDYQRWVLPYYKPIHVTGAKFFSARCNIHLALMLRCQCPSVCMSDGRELTHYS